MILVLKENLGSLPLGVLFAVPRELARDRIPEPAIELGMCIYSVYFYDCEVYGRDQRKRELV